MSKKVEPVTGPAKVMAMDYDGQNLTEREITEPEALRDLASSPTTTWVDVTGLGDGKLLQRLARFHSLPPGQQFN